MRKRGRIRFAARHRSHQRAVIDGDRFAALMIRDGVGVRTDRVVEIKKIDLD